MKVIIVVAACNVDKNCLVMDHLIVSDFECPLKIFEGPEERGFCYNVYNVLLGCLIGVVNDDDDDKD